MKETSDCLENIQTTYIVADISKCSGCWGCLKVCPQGIILKVKRGIFRRGYINIEDGDGCIGCNKCVDRCRRGVFSPKQ
jgi:Uncharacterized Fe-S center protein